jgi:activator of HSP90 ATPase
MKHDEMGKYPNHIKGRETFRKYLNTRKETKTKRYIRISYVSSIYDVLEEQKRKGKYQLYFNYTITKMHIKNSVAA